jgi:hypothetical protein
MMPPPTKAAGCGELLHREPAARSTSNTQRRVGSQSNVSRNQKQLKRARNLLLHVSHIHHITTTTQSASGQAMLQSSFMQEAHPSELVSDPIELEWSICGMHAATVKAEDGMQVVVECERDGGPVCCSHSLLLSVCQHVALVDAGGSCYMTCSFRGRNHITSTHLT